MSAKEREAYLLQPLRKVRDWGKPVDSSFLESAPEPVKTKKQLDDESQLVREAEAIAARGAAMAAMGGTAEVLESPTMASVDIDFSTAEKRGLVVKLCRIERFFVNTDIRVISYIIDFLTGQALGAFTTASKNLYMKTKTSRFTLYMSLRGMAKFSSNVRRGVGFGMIDGCSLRVGATDERCNSQSVNSITAYFTAPALITAKGPIIEQLTIQMDESVNDLAMQSLVNSWSQKPAQHFIHLSVEGCGLQTKGIQLLCDILRKGGCKALQVLNISRNKCLYLGAHKLAKLIQDGKLPCLHTVNINQNDAGHALLDFFDKKFAEATPHLKHFYAQSNLFDVYDPDVVAQRLRGSGKLSWANFETVDLSRNTLTDSEFARMLREQVWPREDLPIDRETQVFAKPSILKNLFLQESDIGNYTIQALSELAVAGYFPNLALLDVGANSIDAQGTDYLLEPLRRKQLPSLKVLHLQLNKVYAPGILLIAAAQSLGVFDSLTDLDLSDIGTSVENIALFAKAIVERFTAGKCSLQRLKVFGVHPFAGKQVRVMFPPEFLRRIRVS